MDNLRLFVVALSNFRQKSFNQVHDLRLWDEYVGAVSGHHLSSTWRASYKLFSIGWKMYMLQFQTEHGLSRSFFVQSQKYFLFRCAGAYVDPDVWVSKYSTSMRKCWSYICWNRLKYASIILFMKIFFINTQYIWLTFLEYNWMQKKVPVREL